MQRVASAALQDADFLPLPASGIDDIHLVACGCCRNGGNDRFGQIAFHVINNIKTALPETEFQHIAQAGGIGGGNGVEVCLVNRFGGCSHRLVENNAELRAGIKAQIP
ncbi:hypothetical protein Barb6_01791 [Bacteroidales bacterium Barb6]|nr:hypothetical protein Barb6_01791 [Bacteroidales bacterium Barb6]